MAGYLLDTDMPSDLVRNPDGAAARPLAAVGEDEVATSVIAAAELRQGAERRGSPRLQERLTALLAELPTPLSPSAGAVCGRFRTALEATGTSVGGDDLLFAAHALASERTMVTTDRREFGRVDGRAVEDWLQGPELGPPVAPPPIST